MGNINRNRVILGGILAGVIIDACEFVINGVVLRQDWADVMTKLGKPQDPSGSLLAMFNVIGLVMGVLTVWLYAGIRARYGAGPKTAGLVAIAVWVLAYAGPLVGEAGIGMIPTQIAFTGGLLGLAEILVATIAGAAVYREDSQAAPVAMSATAR